MIKIAVTGGIGSGKSTACQILQELGYPVFSCDEIYKQVGKSPDYIQKVGKLFPSVVQNGEIDKKALSAIVFSDKDSLQRLNSIAHPIVMETLLNQMHDCAKPIAFAEVPLLFEGGYTSFFDKTLVVMRNKKERVAAVQSRDGLSTQEILDRMNNQFDYSNIKNTSSIYLIKNEGDKKELAIKLNEFLSSISNR